MKTTLPSGLYSLLKIAALTFFGAFLGAFTLSGPIPTTLDGWKGILLPALGAAIAAEVVFLRTTIGTLIANGGSIPVPTSAPVAAKSGDQRGFIGARLLLKLGLAGVVLGLGLVVLEACGSSAFPTLERIVQTIASDLQAGKNDSQMASDVCADLGGSSMTDAVCADAEVVVADVVAMLVQTGSLSGQAAVNAKAFQQRHGILKGGGK